jgi:hypothetical protein
LIGTFDERNKIALNYALTNPTFISALAATLVSLSIPQNVLGAKQAEIITAIANLGLDGKEYASGNHYQASLDMINTVSSATLGILVPYGGTLADSLNIGASFATAYSYGFFWGT